MLPPFKLVLGCKMSMVMSVMPMLMPMFTWNWRCRAVTTDAGKS